jgi:uncharacterized protein with GYD domain
MPTFMTQFSYTGKAWQDLAKHPEDRSIPLRKLTESLGGKLLSLYYAMGDYDGVVIYEAPDADAAATVILAAGLAGHLRTTKTTQLFSIDEALGVLGKVGGIAYPAPEG